MKIKLAAALLLCALLLGCGAAQGSPTAPPDRLSPTKQTENDNLRVYPLDTASCRFLAYGGDLLLLLPEEERAVLARYDGRSLTLQAWAEVPPGAALCCTDEKIGCFDPEGETLYLFTKELACTEAISVPGCTQTPQLWGMKAYYCTGEALMELDIHTGIHRTVRMQAGLHLRTLLPREDMAVCALEGHTQRQCIALTDGTLTTTAPEILAAGQFGSREYLGLQLGFRHCLYLEQTELVLPAGWKFLDFLSDRNAALVYQVEDALGIYDLSTGNCMASIPLSAGKPPEEAVATRDGRIFFRFGSTLYRWEPGTEALRDGRISITPLYTPWQLDEKGLAQCRQRGSFLENQYGIRLLLNEDAARIAPKGCTLEPEHLRPVILDTLAGIETALSRFPAGVIMTAFAGRGSTYLCPVRSIRVDGEEREFLQFWSGQDCYLVLAASADVEKAGLATFLPLIDRQVLMRSGAYDTWSAEGAEAGEEERCRLLYLAMQPGNRELFLDAVLQNKLRTLSAGIREAFSLKSGEILAWEQYLWEAMRT